MIKQNTNQNKNGSKSDDIIGGIIIALYIAGLVIFAHYIVKSTWNIAQRNNKKQEQTTPIMPKKTLQAIDFSKER